MVREDDETWRSIVDNYGERARLDPHDEPAPVDRDDAARHGGHDGRDDEGALGTYHLGHRPDDERPPAVDPDDRFVPPEPPPLPRPPRDRLAAWVGVFGSPAVLLALVVLRVRPPELVSYALVAAFVGGFLYLVLRMSREPRDPWDDGAQV